MRGRGDGRTPTGYAINQNERLDLLERRRGSVGQLRVMRLPAQGGPADTWRRIARVNGVDALQGGHVMLEVAGGEGYGTLDRSLVEVSLTQRGANAAALQARYALAGPTLEVLFQHKQVGTFEFDLYMRLPPYAAASSIIEKSTMGGDGTGLILLEDPTSFPAGVYADSRRLAPDRLGATGELLQPGTDVLSIASTGFYRGQNLVNAPGGSSSWHWYTVQRHDNNDWTHIDAVRYDNPSQHFWRTKVGGAWSSWYAVTGTAI